MQQAVTMPQVEHIVERVEKNFKEEHNTIMQGQRTILDVIDDRNTEMREYIRDMLDNRKERWNGHNRRKQ